MVGPEKQTPRAEEVSPEAPTTSFSPRVLRLRALCGRSLRSLRQPPASPGQRQAQAVLPLPGAAGPPAARLPVGMVAGFASHNLFTL